MSRPETRLLTLTGVGGSGKTRLATWLAADLAPNYPQRTWVVELAAVTDPELVPVVVAAEIGLREVSSRAPVDALAAFLANQPSLLVLDNCEHLVDACAVLVDVLLGSCQGLRIITTSREPLLIPGEQQYRVPPLATPDPDAGPDPDRIARAPAVQLFLARAQAALPSLQLTPRNAETIARICTQLSGIPLALELAAARVGVLGVEQILDRLDDSFRLLAGGSRVAPTRHQTLRAALDWSDALLTDVERTIFRRLSVLAGEFQLTAVEAICTDETIHAERALDALTGLVNKSLVVALSDGPDAWYHLLEPVRQYAVEQLEDQGELDQIRLKHLAFYVDLAVRSAVELRGPNQLAWLSLLERERRNLRVALECAIEGARSEAVLRLAAGLVPFWEAHSHLIEGRQQLQRALSLPATTVDPELRIRALHGLGRLTGMFVDVDGDTSRLAEAEKLLQESLELAMALDDRLGVAAALTDLGIFARHQRDLTRSTALLAEAEARFRELDDSSRLAFTTLNLGVTVGFGGDHARAVDLMSESLESFRAIGDRHMMARAELMLSRFALRGGDTERAIRLCVNALDVDAEFGDRWWATYGLMALAEALVEQARPQQAVQFFAAARSVSEPLGSQVGGVPFENLRGRIDALRHEIWFARTWAEGHAMNLEQAVQAARATRDEAPGDGRAKRSGKPETVSLTRRELDVARLVAQGYTDRQIAESLYVTTRTVGTHVHNMLQKLDLRSRVQIASWLEDQAAADSGAD